MKVDAPYTMYVDNEQCISFTKNITVNSRLRTTFQRPGMKSDTGT